ncbi:outer membrane protein [Cellulosimicrobium sp. KWT-B]|uniref:outer membrane protein n=1 Tax=Cellulosimicrobium sp. KWT-B TaxID=1981152 RepID=UPI000A322CC6|nr:outer membrane beta-barrel protein [Cellulosimicrobium sp. KWT-B]
MNRTYFVLTMTSVLLCVSAFGGSPEYKQVAPAPPPVCGVGWYFALDGGANLYQDFGGDRHLLIGGNDLTVGVKDHIGGFGGIKLGYVFGQGTIRWALEEDLYYNGVNATASANLNGREIAHADAMLNTGAFMTNIVLRFAPNGGCGFQPYIFGGIGGWWGETGGDIDVTVGNTTRSFGSRDNGGFAFQLGAGVDYYFSPKWSVFTEYKFLDYTNAGNEFTNSNVGQHLVGGGLKFHF